MASDKRKRNIGKGNSNGSDQEVVSCERTYVSEKCARELNTNYRHQRKGAVREKRPVSLENPRPTRLRSDNTYVDTSAFALVVPAAKAKPADNGDSSGSSRLAGRPLLDFTTVDEEIMMKPMGASDGQDSINDEFPVYVPWTVPTAGEPATEAVAGMDRRRTALRRGACCEVCAKCRCPACQRRCEVAVDSATERGTADRERGADGGDDDEGGCCTSWFRNLCGEVCACIVRPITRWRICRIFCACFPCFSNYYAFGCVADCPDPCYGNSDIPGCECVRRYFSSQRRRCRRSPPRMSPPTPSGIY